MSFVSPSNVRSPLKRAFLSPSNSPYRREVKIPEMQKSFGTKNPSTRLDKSELLSDYQELVQKSQLMRSVRLNSTVFSPQQQNENTAAHILKLEQRISQLEEQRSTEQIVNQISSLNAYVEKKFAHIERQIQLIQKIKSVGKKAKDSEVQKQLDSLFLQTNTLSHSISQEIEDLQNQNQQFELQLKGFHSKMNKIQPIISLESNLIQNIANFDQWAEKIGFAVQKIERRLARVVDAVVQ
ncbi:Hypothetical_protein [Hexamita inflata]|uniref:Hypothetical_protein n=1 Tax=Hexamita inflata TaxID=28002 RepID=A0AA86N4X2_9EUKA|nr:Hypothetical protein HINF_LOCUS583 [Hexamita inflata]CAI9925873.1 Hypothetical protein HINF_LOCUS13518 [Hexamita inflata]CAI9934914.1 Hypothetical protein HINF_LOCUS22559 [Hexamita inflata]